jgi:hypothetical protein
MVGIIPTRALGLSRHKSKTISRNFIFDISSVRRSGAGSCGRRRRRRAGSSVAASVRPTATASDAQVLQPVLWCPIYSVADPGCLSWIPDTYPSRFPGPESRIPDPTTAPKEEGKIFFVLPFFVATDIIKLSIILFLNR